MPAAPRDFSASGTLYTALGLTSDASAEEIRHSFRRLAITLHPDRQRQPELELPHQHEWVQVCQAYEVLSDERRRDVYDAVGLDGLRLQEWIQSALTGGGAASTAALPPILFGGSLAVGGALLATLLGGFAVLATRNYDHGSWSWPLVFSPLMLANAVLLAVLGAPLLASGSVRPGGGGGGGGRGSVSASFGPVLRRLGPPVALLAVFEALLCARLEQARLQKPDAPTEPLSWLTVFAPLLVSRGVALASLPEQLYADRRAAARGGRGVQGPVHSAASKAAPTSPRSPHSPRPSRFATRSWLLHWLMGRLRRRLDQPLLKCSRSLCWCLAGAAQLSVLPPRLEGILICRWRLLLVPSWLWIFFEVLLTTRSVLYRSPTEPYGADDDDAPPLDFGGRGGGGGGGGKDTTPQEQMRQAWRQTERVLWLAFLCALALTLWWLAAALDATASQRAPASQLFAPVSLGLLGFASCVGCCCASAPSARRALVRSCRRAAGGVDLPSARTTSSTPGVTPRSEAAAALAHDQECLANEQHHAQSADEADVDPRQMMAAAYSITEPGIALPGVMPNPVEHLGALEVQPDVEEPAADQSPVPRAAALP
jgi:hypothetical protein